MKESLPRFRLVFEDRRDYAYARIEADNIDREMAFEYLAEVVTRCADIRQKRLLLERDIPKVMSDRDMSDALNKLLSMSSGMKIAILNKNPGLSKALEEAISANCGPESNCSYFDNPREAIRWLLN